MMFRNIMTLGFIQLGIIYVISFIIRFIFKSLKLALVSDGWISFLGILVGALIYSAFLLKKTPDLFEKISRKRLSFLVGVFHLVVGVGFVLLTLLKKVGGINSFFTSIQLELKHGGIWLVGIIAIVLFVSYLLSVGFTYWGLGMGQKMFAKQQQKLSQKENS